MPHTERLVSLSRTAPDWVARVPAPHRATLPKEARGVLERLRLRLRRLVAAGVLR